MLRNYAKVAIRNLFSNKLYAIINLAGLTIGITGCLLLSGVAIDDLSYDRSWERKDDIYRTVMISNGTQERLPVTLNGLGPALKKNFPEVAEICRLQVRSMRFQSGEGSSPFSCEAMITEPSVWDIFDLPVLSGSPTQYKEGYKNLVITEKIQKQYFHGTDPVGKVIGDQTFGAPSTRYLITGVIRDIPYNSHLRSDAMVIQTFPKPADETDIQGSGYYYPLYILLRKGTDADHSFTSKVNEWFKTHGGGFGAMYHFKFQPIPDVYLHSDFAEAYQQVIGNIDTVYLLLSIAAVILLIACFNFINLTTARAIGRLPEMGVRKVLGAGRRQLISQFLVESLICFTIAFCLSLIAYLLFTPSLTQFLGHQMTVDWHNNILLFILTTGVVLLVSLLTGIYPAWILSAVRPALELKGKFSGLIGGTVIRRILVIGQFVIAGVLLISTLVIHDQLQFMTGHDPGFNREGLLDIGLADWGTKGQAFKQEMLHQPGVLQASITKWVPFVGGFSSLEETDNPTGSHEKVGVVYIEGDNDFPSTLGLRLLKGKYPDNANVPDTPANEQQKILVTEYAARVFSVRDLAQPTASHGLNGQPTGIVKDISNETLRTTQKPYVIRTNNNITYGLMLIRAEPGQERSVTDAVERIWKRFYPEQVLRYGWITDQLQKKYKAENKLQQLFIFFSSISVLLAFMGLYGAASYNAQVRTREIGIRKAIGAEMTDIILLLSTESFAMAIIGSLIAFPMAWWSMHRWLQQYAYRTTMSWIEFVIPALVVILLALFPAGFHAIRAALVNPVKSLRSQ